MQEEVPVYLFISFSIDSHNFKLYRFTSLLLLKENQQVRNCFIIFLCKAGPIEATEIQALQFSVSLYQEHRHGLFFLLNVHIPDGA